MSSSVRLRSACLSALFVLAALGGAGCAEPAGAPSPESPASDPMDAASYFDAYDEAMLTQLRPQREGAAAWVDSLMNALTLREKIGQLFVMEAGGADQRAPVPSSSVRAAAEYGVGGFLVSRLLEPEEVYAQTEYLQARVDVPLFFAADYERGAGRFANNFTELPSNMAVGATRREDFAAEAATLAALESRALGVNLMFAPVVDVNNNPDNPIINIRSYGGQPDLVGQMGAAYVRGAEDFGMLTTLKHFPGHGDTGVDTHAEMATISGSREELEAVELKPYRIILEQKEAQPTAVMGAHLWVKAFDEEPTPATFSKAVLHDLLRGDLGFKGLVFTDDVKMGALQNDFPLKERVLRPLSVGADVVLTPDDLPAAIEAVAEAMQSGRLDQQALDDSVRRILQAKAEAGLHHAPRVPPREVLAYLQDQPRGQALADSIAAASITQLKSTEALPLGDSSNAALVQLSNYAGTSRSIDAAMDTLARRLGPAMQDTMRFSTEPTSSDEAQALRAAEGADVVVLALHLRLATSRGEAGLYAAQKPLVQQLLAQDTPVVLVTLGNPYAAGAYANADAVLVAYDRTVASVEAMAGVLKGAQPAPGRLPITVEPYDFGAGASAAR